MPPTTAYYPLGPEDRPPEPRRPEPERFDPRPAPGGRSLWWDYARRLIGSFEEPTSLWPWFDYETPDPYLDPYFYLYGSGYYPGSFGGYGSGRQIGPFDDGDTLGVSGDPDLFGVVDAVAAPSAPAPKERWTTAVVKAPEEPERPKKTPPRVKPTKRRKAGEKPLWWRYVQMLIDGINPLTGQPFGFDINKGPDGRRYSFPTPPDSEGPPEVEAEEELDPRRVYATGAGPSDEDSPDGRTYSFPPPPDDGKKSAPPEDRQPEEGRAIWTEHHAELRWCPPPTWKDVESERDPDRRAAMARYLRSGVSDRQIQETKLALEGKLDGTLSNLNGAANRAGDLPNQLAMLQAEYETLLESNSGDEDRKEELRLALRIKGAIESDARLAIADRLAEEIEHLESLRDLIREVGRESGKPMGVERLRWTLCKYVMLMELATRLAERGHLALRAIESHEAARVAAGDVFDATFWPVSLAEWALPSRDAPAFAASSAITTVDQVGFSVQAKTQLKIFLNFNTWDAFRYGTSRENVREGLRVARGEIETIARERDLVEQRISAEWSDLQIARGLSIIGGHMEMAAAAALGGPLALRAAQRVGRGVVSALRASKGVVRRGARQALRSSYESLVRFYRQSATSHAVRPGTGVYRAAKASRAPGAALDDPALAVARRRVTQFYDPGRGPFGPGAREALTAYPEQGVKGAFERLLEGPVFGARGPRTWVSPKAASEQNWWSRTLTGRGAYRDYVEFDVLPGETRSVGGLKRAFGLGRYQEFVPGRVSLAGRAPEFGALDPVPGYRLVLPGAAVLGGSIGYAVYENLDDN
jgi:hypothetical protein